MVKKVLLAAFFIIVFLIFVSRVFAATSVSGHKIVIDPGHGGNSPGSTECLGLTEADANLNIARRLYNLLDADGADVYLTRTDNSTKTNRDRYEFANSVNGEALVSVHLNGSTNHTANGTLGLYGKKNKDRKFTEIVHARLAAELGVADRGITNFASGVLLKSQMPATMQETVYISNTNECIALRDGDGSRQQEIAQSLYNGLIDWFAQSDSGDDGGNGRRCETPPCGKNK